MSRTPQPSTAPPHADMGLISSEDVALFFIIGIIIGLVVLLIRYILDSIRSAYQTDAEEFRTAIESTDLNILGNYLRGRLGSLTVRDYVGKTLPRQRVDKYLMKLTEFLGSEDNNTNKNEKSRLDTGENDDSINEPATSKFDTFFSEPPPDVVSVFRLRDRADDPPILSEARKTVEEGTVWTALATLRRDLEQRLRTIIGSKVITHTDVVRIFGPIVGRHYDRFRRVANRAIHGDEVTPESARAALNSARVLYDALDLPQSELNL